MKYDFDTPPSRVGTYAEKYMARKRLFGRDDVLPFWVADMEFAAAPAIRDALASRVLHPIYGYTSVPDSLLAAICAWNRKRYRLTVSADSLTLIPGVMAGVSAAINALSDPADSIVVQTPLYPPLMHTVVKNRRRLLENQLVLEDGRYQINFDGLEHFFKIHRPKIFLFCSPHNPVGRVWSRDEVQRIVELARQHRVYLVSDEIHADIVFAPHNHASALKQAEGNSSRIILLNSASKSFNVAGLNTAYAVIPDRKLQDAFRDQLSRMNLHGVNLFGMIALAAAYEKGEEWLDALLAYLHDNRTYMADRLSRDLPGLQHAQPEGTYLYWLNFNSLGMDPLETRKRLIDKARVGLNDGKTFSRRHEGFWRFNFAVPRTMLREGLDRIAEAFI